VRTARTYVQSSRAACSLSRRAHEVHRRGDVLVVRGRQLRLRAEDADVAQDAEGYGQHDGRAERVASQVAHHRVARLFVAAVDEGDGEALQPQGLVAEQHAVVLEEPGLGARRQRGDHVLLADRRPVDALREVDAARLLILLYIILYIIL
jgi:hypothetical protein